LDEERHKGNPENDEDRDNASLDPREDWIEVVTSRLTGQDIANRTILADQELLVQRSEEDKREHESLDRSHDKLVSLALDYQGL